MKAPLNCSNNPILWLKAKLLGAKMFGVGLFGVRFWLCVKLLSMAIGMSLGTYAYATPKSSKIPNQLDDSSHLVIQHQASQNQTPSLPILISDKLAQANISTDQLSMMVVPLPAKTTLPSNSQVPRLSPIINHLGETPRTPASTQKLITTAIALDTLGADFVWQNAIFYTGVKAGGVVYGDVIIKASGDPSLTHQRLENLLKRLSYQVSHITGDIYIDDGRFVGVDYDPNAFDGQGSRAYNAVPNAFLVNFGTIELRFVPSGRYQLSQPISEPISQQNLSTDKPISFVPTSQTAVVSVYPKLDVPIHRTIPTTQGCELPKVAVRQDGIGLQGRFGAECGTQSLWRNFGNNRLLAQKAVASIWQGLDRDFDGQVRFGTPSTSTHLLALVNQPSEALARQIWQINQFSNNVMTEQVALSLPLYANCRASGYQPTTDPQACYYSTYPKAFEMIDTWWRHHLSTPAPTITRASGLCTDCSVSANAMVSLLEKMYQHPQFDVFLRSLPVAGQSGTMKALATRHPNHPAIGRAWIKTGTLNDVTAMAGYVQGQSGQWYVAVGMINAKEVGYNPKAVAVLDEMLAFAVGL